MKIEYITDEKGNQKSVIIPHKEWKSLQTENIKLKNKLNIMVGLQNALEEVSDIRKGKKKGKTLKAVLNEL